MIIKFRTPEAENINAESESVSGYSEFFKENRR